MLNSYRPVSNLTILSKLIEKCAFKQLTEHLENFNLHCKHQSAYRSGHSCETALMKIYDDVLGYISPTNYVILVFLDFSAAFDTIDHKILLNKLNYEYGINGTVLNWFSSYLSNRNYKVKINNVTSNQFPLNSGVPQGSILGPVLFAMYIKEVSNIALSYNVNVHFYADDVQLYMSCNKQTDFTNLINCIEKIKLWSDENFLKLNNEKTKIITLTSKSYKLEKIKQLKIMGELIQIDSRAKNLGFIFDENLTMCSQINQVCSQGYGILRNLWKISKKLTDKDLKTQLVHSGILSRVNYCSSMYKFLPYTQLKKLQKLINSATRFIFHITGKNRRNHITPYLQQLHFLPISYRIDFKICLIIYKCIHTNSPN